MEYLPGKTQRNVEPISALLHHPSVQQFASSPFASNLVRLHATYLDPSLAHLQTTYLDPSLAHLRSTYLEPYIVEPLSTLLTSMSDITSVLVLLLILLISFKVLDYARRLVMFWVSLVMRLLWWATILSAGLYVYQYGLEKTARDLGWFLGVVRGFAEHFWNGFEGSMTKQGDEYYSNASRYPGRG